MSGRRPRTKRSVPTSEDRLKAVLDSALDAVVTMDEAGAVTGWNVEAERSFGWTAAEAIGRNVVLLMPPPYRDEHDAYLAR